MVNVAQLVRASDCGSEGRGFEPHLSPKKLQEDFVATRGPLFFALERTEGGLSDQSDQSDLSDISDLSDLSEVALRDVRDVRLARKVRQFDKS